MASATVETKIWLALKAHIELLPTSIVPQNAIALPATEFSKPVDANGTLPYVQVRHLPNANQRIMINRGKCRRTGILQLDYAHPLHLKFTNEQLTQQAGLIAEHFPQDEPMKFDDLAVRVERAPDVGRGAEDSGYWRIPVSIRYDCFA